MGRIDTKSKHYLQQKDVFADAFNYYIYDGRPVIRPEDLMEQDISELSVHYRGDETETVVQKYRDVLKLAVLMEDGETAYLMLGLEVQDQVHYAMPVRNMLYDALRYSRQVEERTVFHRRMGDRNGRRSGEFLSGFYKDDRLIPVITLVLLLSPKQWDGPLSIHEMLNMKDEYLLSLVPDYKINLITPHDMDEEKLKKFHTSLREVLEFIKYSEDKEKMRKLVFENERYQEMDPKAVSLLNSCTNVKIRIEEEEEKVNMCKAWEDMAKECEEKGRREEHERMCRAWEDMAKECEEKGRAEGENEYARLTKILLKEQRYEELAHLAEDPDYRKELYQKLCSFQNKELVL